MQFGSECWCGYSSDYAKHGVVAESQCSMACTDNSGVKCGDRDRISMYKYGEAAPEVEYHITLPRPCVLVHGPGLGWASDYVARRDESKAAGSPSGLYLAPSLHNYFGYVEETRPCYCSRMAFVVLNTNAKEWFDSNLQIHTCRSIAIESNPTEDITVWEASQWVLDITNTVVITHYSASLTLAASLANGYCTFDSSSKWATIHTPVGQSFVDAIAECELAGISLLHCTKSNMEEYIAEMGTYTYDELEVTSTFETVLAIVLPGGSTIGQVFQSCASGGDILTGYQIKYFASTSIANRYPEDMQVLYEQTQAQMVTHVSAALRGYGTYGLLSAKSLINDYAATLVTPDEESDGVTPLESCLKLADLQGSDTTFSEDPSDPYYVTSSYFSDVHEFRDSWVGDAAKMREWVDKLRLHEDL